MADQRQAGNELLATGNTSDVWLTSPTTVLKLLRPGVPQHWAGIEADITAAVHAAGLPVPAVEDTVLVDGRAGIVFERILGTSLWECVQASPSDVTLGVRPQNLTLGDTGVPAEVMVVEELGSETFVFLEMEHLGQPTRVRVRVDGDYLIGRGERTHIGVLGPVHAFGPDGLRLLTEDETGA